MSLKAIKDWALPLAIIAGATGGFPLLPSIFLALSQYELYQWTLVFLVVYGLSSSHDVQNALIITVSFYLASKLLALRDVVQATATMPIAQPIAQPTPQQSIVNNAAEAAAAEAAAAEAAAQAAAEAAAAEGFCGGGSCGMEGFEGNGDVEGFCGGGSCGSHDYHSGGYEGFGQCAGGGCNLYRN